MSAKYSKCVRCNEYYQEDPETTLTMGSYDSDYPNKEIDLCLRCFRSFKDFLRGYATSKKEILNEKI